jgi:hypothetical protein
MVVAHFHSIQESLEAVVVAMKHHLYTCEMIDDTIDCTIGNKARIGFSAREPKAIMMFELASDAMEDTERQADALIKDITWLRIA